MQSELDEYEEKKVVLQINDIKPPFLDGRITFTKQLEPVQVVKDPTADIAILAKKGSRILKHVRDQNNRSKMRERFWELAGIYENLCAEETWYDKWKSAPFSHYFLLKIGGCFRWKV